MIVPMNSNSERCTPSSAAGYPSTRGSNRSVFSGGNDGSRQPSTMQPFQGSRTFRICNAAYEDAVRNAPEDNPA